MDEWMADVRRIAQRIMMYADIPQDTHPYTLAAANLLVDNFINGVFHSDIQPQNPTSRTVVGEINTK